MRVYVAAPWTHRNEARRVAGLVEASGHTITWPWWVHEAGDEEYGRLALLARHDINGVVTADALLLLNIERSEGKAVEQGIAIMEGVPIFGVGRPTNIFQHLSVYEWFDTVREAIANLHS